MADYSIKIFGVLSKELEYKFKHVLNLPIKKNEFIFFCDYSSYDIPIGFVFTKIRNDKTNQIFDNYKLRLMKVTQEHVIEYDMIPKGHKTLCKFENVDDKLIEPLKNLPSILSWEETENSVTLL